MASPPYSTASSPPGPANLSLPRQRPNIGLSLPPKHRKNSSASNHATSAHPLRQTSFPPSEGYEREAFSPADSLDSLDDADIRSAVGEDTSNNKKRKRGEKRGRGRPPNNPRANAAKKAGSVNGSESTTKRGAPGAPSIVTHSDEEDEDEEAGENDGEGPGRAAGDFSLLPAEMDRDKQRKFLFREAVPPAHQARYDSFNTVKLKAGEVRKLVNSTLSQSVPANVVTVVGSYTKMFAGMLIEAAREAQAERLAVMEKRPDGEPNPAFVRLKAMEEPPEVEWETESESGSGSASGSEGEEEGGDKEKTPQDGLPDGDPDSADEKEAEETTAVAALPHNNDDGDDENNHNTTATEKPVKSKRKRPKLSHPDPLNTDLPEHDFSTVEPGAWNLAKYIEDSDRGPLQPDDLREALRRYKRSRAGGSVGYTGISLEGRESVAARMGGRRLFK
ncbi:uncharacterized protein RCC_07509 [Ramularia collo-cygni]|uniref:TAFII28-like protein domain-containing protein n=1 Tax=Ramularia collo-cygni TaxID=112498 RepID=A0A2D3VFI1_9PEZI|nr:uncharacterized protein RCC_07509 [Ramularia collo-cygni]CZT21644.1 uncharacterized protein RCC_07509 [Ramularia collo-cygni]